MTTEQLARLTTRCLRHAALTVGLLLISTGCNPDADEDGFTVRGGDCNDEDASVYPNAGEACDGLDNDCDDEIDEELDSDGDGFLEFDAELCATGEDCDDEDDAIHPDAEEQCDEIDPGGPARSRRTRPPVRPGCRSRGSRPAAAE